MGKRQRIRYPSFYRQGLLIVLPAFLLAGIGLFSLRQDRQWARLEATEQAQKLARDLREAYLPEAFRVETAGIEDWQGATPGRFRAEEDPLWKLASGSVPSVGCLVDRAGALVYPPPLGLWLEAEPLPVEDMDEESRTAWQVSQETLYAGRDPVGAIEQLEALITGDLPEPVLALAHYQLGVLWQNAANDRNASQYFDLVLARSAGSRAGGGAALATMAALRLLQISAAAPPGSKRARELSTWVAWSALRKPTVLSRQMLEGLSENQSWIQLWRVHEKARALYKHLDAEGEAIPATPAEDTAWRWAPLFEGMNWLLLARPAGAQTAFLALPETSVRALVEQARHKSAAPSYLGVRIDVAGQSVPPATNLISNLADTALDPSADGAAARFRVRVYLADADALYAGQRARTLRFGALIGVSVGAVLIGLAAAWRAFRRQRELNEMKTNFVSSVSHELRAPIASVRLMAEELEDLGTANPRKNKEYQRFIVQECRRLSGLIENVLDFARHEQGREEYAFESTDLETLVRETARLMQTYAVDKGIEVKSVIRGEPEPVEADGRALQQVLVNLIDNALKHSPAKSTIEVGLEFAAERVVLWVQDHGEGIAPAEHERIFERFYRPGSELRRKTQGVGLGLAIVKNVTEAHGGTVTVDSAVGQGSRFTVTLPIRGRDGA